MKNRTKARRLSLLLIFAMLVVALAVLLPTVASAAPAEIDDFGVQTLTALDLPGDADTDLRFVFTVGSLAYDEVGFVFSKTNAAPTVGGDACVKKETTVVYSSIMAGGTPQSAGDGRYWVAVKLTEIPHEYFDGALYVRPYVDDGDVRYGAAMNTTVCAAAGHKHAPQLLPGHCDGCGLDGVKSGEPYILNSNLPMAGQYCAYGDRFIDSRPYKNICGSEKYYPDESNGYNGNDLLIEFSILYNESLENLTGGTFDITVGDVSDFVNLKLEASANARYGSVVGGFSARDRGDGKGAVLSTPTPAEIAADPDAKYPSIGAYGWHRVGVRIHEEADIVNAAVAYTYEGEVYLDGELILAFDLSKWAKATPAILLYTATIENDELVYAANTSNNSKGSISVDGFYNVSDTYLGIADVFMTCGTDFVQQVVPVADPAAATIEVEESVELSAKMWYTAPHAHVPAAEYTVDLAPTCTTPGSKSYHCTICGAIINETITAVEPTGDAHTPAAEYTIDTPATCTAPGSRSKHCTLCGAIIPETVEPIAMIAHTPADDYTLDAVPTCVAVGSESKHCTVCGAPVAETARDVAIDPDAHNVASWTTTVQPTLLADGTKTGECTLCHNPVVEAVAYGGPSIYYSKNKSSGNQLDKRLYSAIRGEDHFYNGNDLLIEFSILYNESLENLTGGTFDITVGDGSDFVNLKLEASANARYGSVVGGFSARDRNDGLGAIHSTPTPAEIAADPTAKYPSIGAYGWHRVGIRIHEEADIVNDAVAYTFQSEVYLDGELILAFDLSDWAQANQGVLLYTATIENDELVYSDNDAANAWGEIGIYSFYTKKKDIYLVLADVYMTCGTDFVQDVEAVAAPVAASIELGGNNYPAAIYYRFAD